VPIPVYCTRGNEWIFVVSNVSFSSTSMTPFYTVIAAAMMMPRYCRVITVGVFWCVIAVIVPLTFVLALMILMWAVACWSKSVLLMADDISWSILLGSGTLSSLLRVRCLSALLEPVVLAGAGQASFFWFHGGTVSHHVVNVGTDVVTFLGLDEAVAVGVVVGLGAGAGFGIGFGFGFDLSCQPGCGCWCSSGFFGPSASVKSACIEASRPIPCVSSVLCSLWCRSIAATILVIMSMMPLPHSTSSWWYASRCSYLSCNHVFIARHCASGSVVRVSSTCAIFCDGLVYLCYFVGLLLSRSLHSAPPLPKGPGGRHDLAPPCSLAVLLALHGVKCGCARSLRGDGCHCRRHLHHQIHRHLPPPLCHFCHVQVAPLAHSDVDHPFGEAKLFQGSPRCRVPVGRHVGSKAIVTSTLCEPTDMRGFLCASSTGSTDGAGKLPPGSNHCS